VRDEDEVDLAEGLEVLVLGRRAGILRQEGVDHDDLAIDAGQAERRVTKPQDLALLLGEDYACERQPQDPRHLDADP
jgi:hypothetical protein